ncbi:MAG: MFS transporter, partial [Bacteroidetes bacterium]|nr:MFS transporter [Bacteroidota bacterium]
YILTVVTAVLPVYFADVVVPKEGFRIGDSVYSATSLWGFSISASALFVFLCAPVLGAIADFSASKKKFLLGFCYTGSLFCTLLFFCGSGDVWMTVLFLGVSQIGFVGANIFYDAFLPHISTEDKLDWVSGKGYAYGYVGSHIQFLICLLLILGHETLGISSVQAVKAALVFSGLWWAGFSLFTWKYLLEAPSTERLPDSMSRMPVWAALMVTGFQRTLVTLKKIRSFKHLMIFLLAFMLYNEGIQTVINMATIYGKEELGLPTSTLMITLFVIQLVAMLGALLFSKLAHTIGTRRALMTTLVGWSAVVIYAFFMTTSTEYMILGLIVGVVLGGSQSLSRSYYAAMIPVDASAEFYGFYSVFTKFSAIWGPFAFAVIRQVTGSARLSIISLIVFFIAGILLLSIVNEQKAKEARLA